MRRITAALALTALPLTAMAQSEGTITGTLDLEPANWTIIGDGDVPLSTFEEQEGGYLVTLRGYPDPNDPSVENSIEITFLASGTITEPEVEQTEIVLMRGDPPLRAEGANANVELTAFEPEGDSVAIAGNLFTTMIPGGSDEIVANQGDESVTFDGNFQATIFRGGELE